LIDAKKRVIDAGLLGAIGHVDMCCYFGMRANGDPPEQPVPDHFDSEMWTGPAPLRPFDGLPHRRWWRTFMEYGNGIVGDMCVHLIDTVRWMLGLGWPRRISSQGGIYVQTGGKSNISDTQTAMFDYDGLRREQKERRDRGDETDGERDPSRGERSCEHVAADRIGAQQMAVRQARGHRGVGPVRLLGAEGQQPGPEDCGQREDHKHPERAGRRQAGESRADVEGRGHDVQKACTASISTSSSRRRMSPCSSMNDIEAPKRPSSRAWIAAASSGSRR